MIITITLNPAVDRVVKLAELRLGDSNRVVDGETDPGGKGINVSRVIRELGGDTLAMGFVAGSLGLFIERSLNEAGIRDAFIHTPGQTRTNLAIVETKLHRHTMLNEAGPPTDPQYFVQLRRRLSWRVQPGQWVVIAGSVPPGLPSTVYADLIREMRERGAHTALDTDGQPLIDGVSARPDLIKPNREELERLVDRRLPTLDDVIRAAEEIHQRGIRIVVVSLGKDGSVAVADNQRWRAIPPTIKVVSAVGAGDSLVAGLVLALSKGWSLKEGLTLGTAAGAATTLRPGTQLAQRADIERLLPQVVVEPI